MNMRNIQILFAAAIAYAVHAGYGLPIAVALTLLGLVASLNWVRISWEVKRPVFAPIYVSAGVMAVAAWPSVYVSVDPVVRTGGAFTGVTVMDTVAMFELKVPSFA